MTKQLAGWDLATWRVSQSDSSKVANIVSVVEISGVISRELLLTRIKKTLEYFPILRMGVFENDGIHLEELPEINFRDAFTVSTDTLGEIIHRLSKKQVGTGDCLWEIVLVQQLDKSFLIGAIHHAIADGNSAMAIMNSLFDGYQPVHFSFEEPFEKSENDFFENLKTTTGTLISRLVSDPAGLAEDATAMLKSATRLLISNAENLNRKSSSNFVHQFFKIEKMQLKKVASPLHVSVHDVITAISVLAFIEYTKVKNISKESVIVNVPVAMNLNDAVANKLIVARIDVPTKFESISELIYGCRDSLKKWRQEPALSLASGFVEIANQLPLKVITDNLNKSDLTVSSLAGTSQTLRLAGYEINAVWPVMSPVGAAINFTSLLMNNHLHLGITIDRAAIEDLELWQASWSWASKTVLGLEIFEQIFE